ncbi:phospholipase C, phosphocholine-specific [Panacibacter ginsenosidivorans]|uniref:phospholipase C n=1 Tax=Panacibacter ginsenosidivorans TaxID=1813871 RepID=A0A5B8V7U7_9BACT|nr:phospholipase C, phosphocholine-specific [Panacibacter ginsenosidivorans]QEC67567.1 phospholipase C, phosphocholine-specific [Panacibacter ginsenosidivorans]
MDNRRDFIKKAAMLAGGAGLINMLPPSVQKALAINPAPGTTWQDAEHVVLLMQENRSFDHCFGMLKGVRGFNDPRAIKLPNNNKVWLQTNAKGETYAPFRLNIKDTKATWMSSLPHSWSNQVDARNNGKFDKWLDAKRPGKPYEDIPMTMGYYTREDIPFYYAMADAFTVCDQHFCSSLTGTTPNRLFFWTGTVREDANHKARVRNADTDYGVEAAWKTFPERLEENGVSWKIYQNEISVGVGFEGEEEAWLANFTDNPIEWFSQYKVKLSKGYLDYLQKAEPVILQRIESLKSKVASANADEQKKITEQIADLEKQLAIVKEDKKNFTKEKYDQLSAFEKNIHDKAFTTNSGDAAYHELTTLKYKHNDKDETLSIPKGDVLHQFRSDVANGKLPTVSWIVAPENFSDHPTSPWYGAWYISEVMDILTKNPEVWKKTIFILTYDENDGCFDHVPPFVPPHSKKPSTGLVTGNLDTTVEQVSLEEDLKYYPKDEARESPIGLGYRVPLIIASPWSRGGWVNSEVFDHTSSLQFLEKFITNKFNKKIEETNISTWRRHVCGDLTSVFRPYNGEQIDALSFPSKETFIESIHQAKFKAIPDNFKNLTAQEIAVANNNPSVSPYMPQQEKGVKPACALAYELYADGNLSADRKQYQIKLIAGNTVFGSNANGAPFHVYSYNKEVIVKAYTVTAGNELQDAWPLTGNGNYDLHVYAPNGFYRAFTGDANDPRLKAQLKYEFEKGNSNALTGNLILSLYNVSSKDLAVQIKDNAYHNPVQTTLIQASSQEIITLNLGNSAGWYDISITVDGSNTFLKRFAGHIDTGKHSFTDPLMGGTV